MGSPKRHAVFTLPLIILFLICYMPIILFSKNSLILGGVIFFGIFLDIDHLTLRIIKEFIQGKKVPMIGKINYLHTWYGLIVIAVISIIGFKSLWPLFSYLLHIFIDSCNIGNQYFAESPLSNLLYRKIIGPYFPNWIKYNYDPFKLQPPSN